MVDRRGRLGCGFPLLLLDHRKRFPNPTRAAGKGLIQRLCSLRRGGSPPLTLCDDVSKRATRRVELRKEQGYNEGQRELVDYVAVR